MPPEQNTHGRRPHYHRGRRGPDRRGPDRRTAPQPQSQDGGGRDHTDVEQLMREIRARISQRHGIELSTQQIQELAARRLEAILDPRTVKPSLLEQLRRSAGAPDPVPAETTPSYVFEDRTMYESHNGLLRFIRKLLNPILRLFFNPNTIAHAINAQTKLNAEAAAREAERDRRQGEWNALHYEILQRVVMETARISIEMQNLAGRVESLGARVDFNDKRVRTIEAQAQAQPARAQQPRQAEPRPVPVPAPAAPAEGGPPQELRPADAASESGRRRRRRRRGRRGAALPGEAGVPTGAVAAGQDVDVAEGLDVDDVDEPFDEEGIADRDRVDTTDDETAPTSSAPADTAPAPQTAAAAPPPFPQDDPAAVTSAPTPPKDEPAPVTSEPPDPGTPDR